jgi:hypothetical protein
MFIVMIYASLLPRLPHPPPHAQSRQRRLYREGEYSQLAAEDLYR